MATRFRAGALIAASLCCSASPALAQKELTINFDSDDKVTLSSGGFNIVQAEKSTLTAEQRAAIVKKVQAEYDDALGPDKIKVKDGKAGDIVIVVTGGKPPDPLKSYGNAGEPARAGVVFQGQFGARNFTGDELVNGVSVAVAHEAGHKLGLQHNSASGDEVSKMTKGGSGHLDDAKLKADNLKFNGSDSTKLTQTLDAAGNGNLEQKPGELHSDLGAVIGNRLGPDTLVDRYLDVFVHFQGPAGATFGYLSFTGVFVPVSQVDTPSTDSLLTFIYDAGTDLAVSVAGEVFSLSGGWGSYTLSRPNPDNPGVFQEADAVFRLGASGATALVELDADVDPTTGGFVRPVPEPGGLVLLLVGMTGLLIARHGRRQKP